MTFYEDIYQRAEQQRTETKNQKDNFKRALLELFKKGLTPEQITLEMLGQMLNIPKEKKGLRVSIDSKIYRLFGCGKKTIIAFLFEQYQEKKS